MSKMLSTYGLTRLPFSKDILTSEMLDTEALQAARERLKRDAPADRGCVRPFHRCTGSERCPDRYDDARNGNRHCD